MPLDPRHTATRPVRSATARRLMLALCVAAVVATLAPSPTAAQRRGDSDLMTPIPGALPRAAALLATTSLRQGLVRVRPALLAASVDPTPTVVAPFPDLEISTELSARRDPNEGEIWVGRVAGDPAGRVHLRRVGDSVAGSIRTRAGIVQLLPDGPGRAIAVQADPVALPDLVEPLPARLRRAASRPVRDAAPGAAERRETTTVIDLMVVIEKRVIQDFAGKVGLLNGLIRNALVDLNLALADSEVNAEFNLQAIKRDRYPGDFSEESNYASQLLQAVTDPDDGVMKKTSNLRKRFGADMVAVIMGRNNGVCGMAWVSGARNGVRPGDEAGAYSVTSWRCIQSGTLAHEIGHNMGGQHAHLDPTGNRIGAYDESFGHKVLTGFTTIMAYSCEFCTSALLFSNPEVLFEGQPAGVAAGPEAAANAWGFERDREVIAGFRECRKKCAPGSR